MQMNVKESVGLDNQKTNNQEDVESYSDGYDENCDDEEDRYSENQSIGGIGKAFDTVRSKSKIEVEKLMEDRKNNLSKGLDQAIEDFEKRGVEKSTESYIDSNKYSVSFSNLEFFLKVLQILQVFDKLFNITITKLIIIATPRKQHQHQSIFLMHEPFFDEKSDYARSQKS